jgi:membrane associated rhomboid family serine protease
MLIPVGHDNMTARRWPVITIGLIVINVVVFLFTNQAIERQGPELGEAKAHILILAAQHPELKMQPEAQHLVDSFQQSHPAEWKQIQNPYRDVIDAYDAKVKLMDDNPDLMQKEMDTLTAEYVKVSSASMAEQYAFVPAKPNPISYLTANFLHGGWLHLIGNMWFLWLAGFVLEDAWGRALYTVFYLVSGAAALQFYAWSNPGSITPTLGASGAVAALMGAFLVRFPKMKIEMAWLFMFRLFRFKAAAYWLLPLWLLMEMFYGSLFGSMSGVAHWAHVGGFLFGALAAFGLQYTNLEHKTNKAVEEKIAWTADPEIDQANTLMDRGQLDEAAAMLNHHLTVKPDSIDAWNLVKQIHWRKQETAAFHEATMKTCALHLKARNAEAAWKDYEEFLNSGGNAAPPQLWLELCKAADDLRSYERTLYEYQRLAAAYPNERQALMAQLGAAKLCLKRLNRPQDALAFYQAASASKIPHLDWEQNIQAGIKEAKAALAGEASLTTSAQ